MPRLSLDAELDQLLEESRDSTRYRDFAMQVRRLTLPKGQQVPEDTDLFDESGTAWVAGPIAKDGQQPIRTIELGASAHATTGHKLIWAKGAVTLHAEVIVSAGGIWDSPKNDWRRDAQGKRLPATSPVIVDLVESQIEAAHWFAGRLAALRDRKPHPHAVGELFSDRRAGKTFVCLLFILLACIDIPTIDGQPLVAWLVSLQHNVREELDAIIKSVLPSNYYTFRELPKRMFRFANGATLLHKTIDDADGALKAGRVDIALLNEGANLPFIAYRNVLRATQDKQGVMLIATNTPTRTKGAWVVKLAEGYEKDLREGREPAVKLFRLDPKQNAAIAQGQAKSIIDRALRYGLDESDEIDEGLILESDAKCYSPPFSDTTHVKPLPQVGLVDITFDLTRRLYGKGYNYLIGEDWQQQCAAAAHKIYAPLGAVTNNQSILENFVVYCTHSWFLSSGGDEDDILDAIEASGLTNADCLTIGDCSGHWQKGNHGYGNVSFKALQRRNWEVTGVTKPKTSTTFPKNPPVEQSVGRLRRLLSEGRYYVVPGDNAKSMAIALRKCDAVKDRYGNLRPKGIHAHLGDCARYPIWWLLARPDALVNAALPAYARGK